MGPIQHAASPMLRPDTAAQQGSPRQFESRTIGQLCALLCPGEIASHPRLAGLQARLIRTCRELKDALRTMPCPGETDFRIHLQLEQIGLGEDMLRQAMEALHGCAVAADNLSAAPTPEEAAHWVQCVGRWEAETDASATAAFETLDAVVAAAEDNSDSDTAARNERLFDAIKEVIEEICDLASNLEEEAEKAQEAPGPGSGARMDVAAEAWSAYARVLSIAKATKAHAEECFLAVLADVADHGHAPRDARSTARASEILRLSNEAATAAHASAVASAEAAAAALRQLAPEPPATAGDALAAGEEDGPQEMDLADLEPIFVQRHMQYQAHEAQQYAAEASRHAMDAAECLAGNRAHSGAGADPHETARDQLSELEREAPHAARALRYALHSAMAAEAAAVDATFSVRMVAERFGIPVLGMPPFDLG